MQSTASARVILYKDTKENEPRRASFSDTVRARVCVYVHVRVGEARTLEHVPQFLYIHNIWLSSLFFCVF